MRRHPGAEDTLKGEESPSRSCPMGWGGQAWGELPSGVQAHCEPGRTGAGSWGQTCSRDCPGAEADPRSSQRAGPMRQVRPERWFCGTAPAGAACRSSRAVWGAPVKACWVPPAQCQSWSQVPVARLWQSPWAGHPSWLQEARSQRQSAAAAADPAVFGFSMVLATVVLVLG